jgi:hypothetical protein
MSLTAIRRPAEVSLSSMPPTSAVNNSGAAKKYGRPMIVPA